MMRSLYATFAAIALLGTAVSFGQQQNPGNSTTESTVPKQQAEINPGGNDKPTKALMATCKKQAADKKLSGDAKKEYLRDCEAGKTTREGH